MKIKERSSKKFFLRRANWHFVLSLLAITFALQSSGVGIVTADTYAQEPFVAERLSTLPMAPYTETREVIQKNGRIFTATSVTGYINTDTTWTASNSPYVVSGNVVVSSGVTLTIEPGVTVKFDIGKSLQVDGALIAKGSSAERITFTKNGSDNWGYILFNDSSKDAQFDATSGSYTSGSTLEYCIIEYAGGVSVSNNGAVRVDNAHPFINYCTINTNSVPGIYAWNISGTLKITNSSSTNNTGNGIYISSSSSGKITISNNTVTNNIASSNGGGIYCNGGTKTISNNTVSNNKASSTSTIYGGGIYCRDGTNAISGNTISNNSVSTHGGGVSCYGGTNTISNNTITNNTADDDGGGILCDSTTATVSNNTITGNIASDTGGTYAGGGIAAWSSTVTISNNTISNNKASGYGGGINCYRGTNTIKNNVISNNTSSDYGGGIHCGNSGTNTISNNTITDNTADVAGGGVWCGDGYFTVTKNHVVRNTAPNAAGVRYYSNSDGKDFKYNTLTENNATGTSSTYTTYISSKPVFNYNNLFNNTATYELWNGNAYGSTNLDAKNNWWGTTVDADVQTKIYEWIDDSAKGVVTYYPYETAIRTDAPISPPTNVTATEGSGQIALGWSANSESDTAGYKVYWDTDSGHPYTNSVDVGSATSYTVTGLDLTSIKYYVTVTAYDTNYSSATDDSTTLTNENQTNGYESSYAREKALGDTSAPTGGSVSINSGAAYTTTATVTLALSATDNVGVTGYYVAENSSTPSLSASAWNSVTSTTSYTGSASHTLSSGDGNKTVYVWYKDAAGNISSLASDSITLDTTSPTVTITSPTSNATYSTTSATISLGGSASDMSGVNSVAWSNDTGGSGTAGGTTSWNVSSISLSSGTNTITVTATDGAGNTGIDTITVSSDTAPTGTVTVNSNVAYTNSTLATLSLSATDNTGVAAYYVSASSTTPSASASSWVPITSTAGYVADVPYTLSSGDGTKTVYVWYKDIAGNVSNKASDSIVLDTTSPTATITSPTSGATYTTTNGTLSLGGSASDGTSGVSSVAWSNDRGGSGTASGTASWSVSGISLASGSNVITVTVTDNAGNTGTKTLTVTYNQDLGVPGGSVSINNGASYTTSASVTLSLSATDDMGVTGYYVSASSTAPSASDTGWKSFTSTTSYTGSISYTLSSGDGEKTVYVWYKDAAGNVSGVASDSIILDTAAPTGSVSINGGDYTNSTTATLTLSASDSGGVTGYYISTSSSTPSASASGWVSITSSTGYSGSVSYTLSSGDGNKTVYVWYKDVAGKVSSSASDSITLDTVAPTATITSPTSDAAYTTKNSTISLYGSASDDRSGIKSVAWSNSKGGDGTASGTTSWSVSGISLSSGDNVITVTVKDAAGNSGTDTITVTYNTQPTTSGTLSLSKETAYLSGDTIVATVVDNDGNVDSSSVDTMKAILSITGNNFSLGASLKLNLVEDSVNSGTFLATIQTGTKTTQITENKGMVYAIQGGTVRVTYSETDPARDVVEDFKLSAGDATLAFDADTYDLGAYAVVTLADAERNTSHLDTQILTTGKVFINTSSTNNTTLKMVETGTDTGIFKGSIQIVSSGGTLDESRIQAAKGDTLTVSYVDEINTTGSSRTVKDTALVKAAVTPTPSPVVTPKPSPVVSPVPSATPTATIAAGSIVGRVTDLMGIPISGATVSTDTGGYSATTGADGVYTIDNVAPSAYTVTASATGYTSASTVVVVSAGVPVGADFVLAPSSGGSVFGFVYNDADEPMKGVKVGIVSSNYTNNTETDESGYYQFDGLAAGSYTLTYTKEGYKTQMLDARIGDGEAKGLDTVVMEEIVRGKITGFVYDIKGNPIESVKLKLNGIKTKMSKSTASDQDGFFEFTDLDADTYVIIAKKKRYKQAKTQATLEEGESVEVELEMRKTTKRVKGMKGADE